MLKLIATVFVFGALSICPTLAIPQSLDKSQVESIVKDYLLKNPELIQQALLLGRQKQEQEKMAAQNKALASIKDKMAAPLPASVYGNPNGDVTLVEFFDYNCGYCKRALGDAVKLVENDKNLKIVLKEYPALGEPSMLAAIVGIAMQQIATPKQYWDFHNKLMNTPGTKGKDEALEVAKTTGVDMDKLQKQMESPAIREYLSEIAMLTQTLQIGGTPSYILGNEVIGGARGYNYLSQRIANVRKCGKTECS